MKKRILTILAALTAFAATAQTPTAYFIEGSTFRSQLNPALAPLRGYINIPALGGIQASIDGNLSFDRLFYPTADGRLVTLIDPSVPASTVLESLNPMNKLGADLRINLFGYGSYTKNRKNFWSFDMSLRMNLNTGVPYELFEFVKLGGHTAHIENLNLSGQAWMEAAFAYSFPVTDNLYLGARAKLLVGMFRGNLAVDQLNLSLQEDRWHAEAAGSFEIGGLDLHKLLELEETIAEDLDPSTLKLSDLGIHMPGGYGFAVDLGATYNPLPDLQISLAVNDLGFISWPGKNGSRGELSTNKEFTGVEIVDGQASEVEFDFSDLEFTPAELKTRNEMLRCSVNAGIEYRLWKRRIGIGLLYNMKAWERQTMHHLTASVNFAPVRWFSLTGSYTMFGGAGHSMGLALNLCPKWINFFVATDLLVCKHTPQWIPVESTSMNFTFGIGIPIGKYGERNAR